jgi:hypothetical protein
MEKPPDSFLPAGRDFEDARLSEVSLNSNIGTTLTGTAPDQAGIPAENSAAGTTASHTFRGERNGSEGVGEVQANYIGWNPGCGKKLFEEWKKSRLWEGVWAELVAVGDMCGLMPGQRKTARRRTS